MHFQLYVLLFWSLKLEETPVYFVVSCFAESWKAPYDYQINVDCISFCDEFSYFDDQDLEQLSS